MQPVRLLSDSINGSVFTTHLGQLNHYQAQTSYWWNESPPPPTTVQKTNSLSYLSLPQRVSTCLIRSVTVLLYPSRKYSCSYIHSHKWAVMSRVEHIELQCHTHSVWVVQMDQFFSLSSALLVWTKTYLTYVNHSLEVRKRLAIWLKMGLLVL